jgi:hypothetical protein
MTPAVSFSSSSSGSKVGASQGRLAELAKHEQMLSRKLAEASRASPPPPPPNDRAESISREIIGVQAQIEQIILEAQLSRLSASASSPSPTPSPGPGAAPGPAAPSPAPAAVQAEVSAAGPARDHREGASGGTTSPAPPPHLRSAPTGGPAPAAGKPAALAAAHYEASPPLASYVNEAA